MTEMIIKETIHHGDYYNVRTLTLRDATYDDFYGEVRKTCPYRPHGDSTNRFERQCWDDLVDTGKGTIGWCRYELVS